MKNLKYSGNKVISDCPGILKKSFSSIKRFRDEISGRKVLLGGGGGRFLLPEILEVKIEDLSIFYEDVSPYAKEPCERTTIVASFSKIYPFLYDNIKAISVARTGHSNTWIDEIETLGNEDLGGKSELKDDFVKIISIIRKNLNYHGLMHGDLSMSNILYAPDVNQVYLVDYEFTRDDGDPVWDLVSYTWNLIKLSREDNFYLILLEYLRENLISILNEPQSKLFSAYLCRKLLYSAAFNGYGQYNIKMLNLNPTEFIHKLINKDPLKRIADILKIVTSEDLIDPESFNSNVKKYYLDDSKISKIIYFTNAKLCGLDHLLIDRIDTIKYLSDAMKIDFSKYGSRYKKHIFEYIAKQKIEVFLDKRLEVNLDYIWKDKLLSNYKDKLIDFLLPSTTYFNRDVYPLEIYNFKNQKILCLGCSTGAEVYSFLSEAKKEGVQIYGVDRNKSALQVAIRGIYPKEIVSQATAKYPKLSYIFKDGIVRSEIRTHTNFVVIDLLKLRKVFNERDFDIIICRNTIKYYSIQNQKHLLAEIAHLMKKDGILVVGKSKDGKDEDVTPSDILPKDFKRIGEFVFQLIS